MSEEEEKILQMTDNNQSYDNTMEALRQAETAMPNFSSSYDKEISRLYEQIVNRPDFRYDPTSDPLYGTYRDSYVREGRMAMKDTIGQTSHLTGGYASSYAASVGQQQYGAYLEKLGQIMPELYSAAYDRYIAEGDRLNAQLSAATGLAGMEFERYTDEQNRAAQSAQQTYERRWAAYQNLISLISKSGYQPDIGELEATGMSQAQADALRNEYLRVNNLLPVENNGGGSPDYYSGGTKTDEKVKNPKEQIKLAANANGMAQSDKKRRL